MNVQLLRRVFTARNLFALLIICITVLACRCTPLADVACTNMYPDDVEAAVDCWERYDAFCPEPDPFGECLYEFQEYEAAHPPTQEPEDVSGPAPTPNPQQSQVVAPQADCDAFRLTAPLDGLPNGGTTFYWDPIPQATSYSVSVFDGGTLLGSWSAPAGATSVGADVSSGAIGGGFVLTVVAQAHTNGETCTSAFTLEREAGSAPAPQGNDDDDHDAPANNGSGNNGGNNNNGGGQQPDPEPTPCNTNDCIR